MYLLRRAAIRSFSSQSSAFLSKPRTIVSKSPVTLRAQQQWSAQRRFASNEASPAEASTSGETVTTKTSKAEQEIKDEVRSAAEPVAEQARDKAEDVKEKASDAQSTLVETAQNAAESVKETAASTADVASSIARSAAGRLLGRTAEKEDVGTFGQPKPSKILYTGNLFFEVTAEDLQREFSRFGEVLNCRIAQDPKGLSKGFGYVEFADVDQATKAMQAMDQQTFSGRRMAVQYHVRRENNRFSISGRPEQGARPARPVNPPSKTLFIGNMSFQMSDKDLNDAFRDVRNVVDVRVAIDRRSGQPRGFAHADFIDVKSATEAKDLLENKVIFGRQLRVDFSKDSENISRGSRE